MRNFKEARPTISSVQRQGIVARMHLVASARSKWDGMQNKWLIKKSEKLTSENISS